VIKEGLPSFQKLSRVPIFSNLMYLSLLQGSSFLLPLILIPYLVNRIGFEKVGLVYFAQSFMSYFAVLTEYGFNLTATQEISVNRNNRAVLNTVFNDVLTSKVLLSVFAFLVLMIITYSVPRFSDDSLLYLSSFLIVIGQSFFPSWFFQGLEDMKYVAFLSFFGRIIFTLLILVFVREPQDYLLVNLFSGLGNCMIIIYSFYIIKVKYRIAFRFSGLNRVMEQLSGGWHIFISSFAVNVYMNSNIFILGLFTDKTTLGYYGVAEKSFLALRQVLTIFSQAIYPHVCRLGNISHLKLVAFYRKIIPLFLVIVIASQVLIFYFAPFIVFVFTHGYNAEIIYFIRLYALLPLIIALNIPAYQSVIIYKIQAGYGKVLISGAVINIICNAFLAKAYGAFGTIASIYITEIFITIGLYYILENFNAKYSLFKST
jgi:polysaccharide transporter, PST family